MMNRFTSFAALTLGVLASACAAGDAIQPPTSSSAGDGGADGAGGGRDGGGSSGDGGRGATTTSNTGSTTSTTTTSSTTTSSVTSSQSVTTTDASSSSTGSPCDEQPCKLVSPQCGCGVDEKCTLDGGGDRTCVADGTRTQGQECGNGLGDCQAGALCVYVFDTDDTISSCSRFCESDDACEGQGGLCTLGLNGVADVKLCSDNCDPVTGSGCAISGTTCGVGFDDQTVPNRYFTVCSGDTGTGIQYDPCDPAVGCSAGNICLETDQNVGEFVCFQWCSSAAPNCPNGLSCFTGFDPALQIGNVTYGVCQG